MFHLENLSLESISEFHLGLQHFFQEIAVYSSKNSCEVLCTAVQLFLTAVLYLKNQLQISTAVAVLYLCCGVLDSTLVDTKRVSARGNELKRRIFEQFRRKLLKFVFQGNVYDRMKIGLVRNKFV